MAKKAKKVWRHQTYEALAPENITGVVGIDSSLTGMGIARKDWWGPPGTVKTVKEDAWERIGTDADFGSDVQRYFHTLKRVLEIVQPGDLCFMEQYALGSPNRNALVQLAGLGEIVRFGIWRKTKREPVMIAPAQLKFFIWGKGVLKKDAVKMEILEKFGIKFDSTDEAEAYALMDLGTLVLFSNHRKTLAYERKVVEEVRAEWFRPKNLS